MSRYPRRTLAFTSPRALARLAVLAGLVALAAPAAATAAGPVRGAKYTGTTVQGKQPIGLKVAASGKSVTVSIETAPAFCQGGSAGTRQITKPATISAGGSFKGSISYEFEPEKKITAKLYFSGRFSGRTVKGTARSEFLLAKECDGSTSFTAKAGAAAARAAAHAQAAASKLRVTKHLWEVGQGGNVHEVAAGGKLEYCAAEPATGLTPVIAYSHAPVGKSYTLTLAGPPQSGTVTGRVKIKFAKASGRVSTTYAAPSFPQHQIAAGKYTFSLLVSGKTVASESLTLDPTEGRCAG